MLHQTPLAFTYNTEKGNKFSKSENLAKYFQNSDVVL